MKELLEKNGFIGLSRGSGPGNIPYRYMVVIFIHRQKNLELFAPPLRDLLVRSRINYRPDVICNTGPGPGMKPGRVTIDVMRIILY